MKLKLPAGQEIRFDGPGQPRLRPQTDWLCHPRLAFRALALAERTKPCQRHID